MCIIFKPSWPWIFAIVSAIASTEATLHASSYHLSRLADLERSLLKDVKDLVETNKYSKRVFKQFVADVTASLTRSPEVYVSHPIDALILLKRWEYVRNLPNDQNLPKEAKMFLDEVGKKVMTAQIPIPSQHDVYSGYKSITRLQMVYNLDFKTLAKGKFGGIEPVHKLTAKDYMKLAQLAEASNTTDGPQGSKLFLELSFNAASTDSQKLEVCMALVSFCNTTRDWNCVRKYAKKAHMTDPQKIPWSEVEHLLATVPSVGKQTSSSPGPKTSAGSADVCRLGLTSIYGGTHSGVLMCRYRAPVLPYVRYKEEILSVDPDVSVFLEVISDNDSDAIIELAGESLSPSETKTKVSPQRVSANTWIAEYESAVIRKISRRVSEIIGLNTFYDNSQPASDADMLSEPFQVVNYGLGGHYVPHLDYYRKGPSETEVHPVMKAVGNRLATFLIYFTDVEAGGYTVFPYLKLTIPPRKGSAAFWYNALRNGDADERTFHGSCPILFGNKWIANKWIGQHGQEFLRPCDLDPAT